MREYAIQSVNGYNFVKKSTPLLGGYTVVWAKVFTIVGYSEYIKEKPTDLLGSFFLLTR
jgi:hypothetical protein